MTEWLTLCFAMTAPKIERSPRHDEQIRQRNKAENAAAQRLQAAGYRLEGWDPRTGQRIAAQITGENTNDERRTFYAFPTWQDAAAALLG